MDDVQGKIVHTPNIIGASFKPILFNDILNAIGKIFNELNKDLSCCSDEEFSGNMDCFVDELKKTINSYIDGQVKISENIRDVI